MNKTNVDILDPKAQWNPSGAEISWSFFSWIMSALFHFFLLQFVADSRTRDYLVEKAKRRFDFSHHIASFLHLVGVFFWGFSGWGLWLRGGFAFHGGLLFFYFVLLGLELSGWILFWEKKYFLAGSYLLLAQVALTFILCIVGTFTSKTALGLLGYLGPGIIQFINYRKFALSNKTLQLERITGRLRERSTRANASTFFAKVQEPERSVVERHISDIGNAKLSLPENAFMIEEDDT